MAEEWTVLRALLPPARQEPAVDVATAGGHLLPALRSLGYAPIGVDLAWEMLLVARQRASGLLCGDVTSLPFARSSVGGVLAHRFLFHYSRLDEFLNEFARIVRPGGWLCFDLLQWSPGALSRRISRGSNVYVHPLKTVLAAASSAGFAFEAERAAFLLNPALVRFMPHPLAASVLRADTLPIMPRVKRYLLFSRVS
jgi:SAM-dependent methyltransferase